MLAFLALRPWRLLKDVVDVLSLAQVDAVSLSQKLSPMISADVEENKCHWVFGGLQAFIQPLNI